MALTYPWEKGTVPAVLEIEPPLTRPSGWQVLAWARLISESTYGEDRGVMNPGPLVAACLAQGSASRLRYRVLPGPVRITTYMEAGEADDAKPAPAVTDSERCVEAVLGATIYPGSRGLEINFANEAGAPIPAEPAAVAVYFLPKDAPESAGALDPQQVKETMQLRAPQITACWETALKRRAGLAGTRTFRMRVAPSGEVAHTQVVSSRNDPDDEAADYLFDQCLAEAIRGARFPNPTGGQADAAYSWVFAHRR